MRKAILLFVLLCLYSNAFSIYFKHIGMQDGLSQLSVMSIYQDKLGRMWFGTEEGLSIYDGVRTLAYKPSDDHTDEAFTIGNKIQFITGNRDGSVYFNSDNSLVHYDIQTQRFRTLRTRDIHAVAAQKGTVYVGVSDSLFTIDPATHALRFVLKLNKSNQYVYALQVDSKDRLWIGTNSGLFVKEKDKELTCLIPHEDIYSLFEDSQNNLWISIRLNGMYKKDANDRLTRFVYDPHNKNGISSNQVREFTEDNFGNIWIGTFTGLNKYNPRSGQFTVYTHTPLPGSLTHSSVFPVYKDNQGSIWLGTYYGGVNYFNPEMDLFSMYAADATRDDCLDYPFVGHMIEDKDNNIWICTEGGGLNHLDRRTKKFTHILSNENHTSVAHNNLKGIAYDASRNKLYIGTHTGGLSIYDIKNRKFKNPYFEDPGYASRIGDRITRMCIRDHYLIFSTQLGTFKMNLDTEEISTFFDSGNNYGTSGFLIDSKGYMWISYGEGIWRINPDNEADRIQYRCNEKGLGRLPVTQMVKDRKGRIYVGTNGSGLFCYDQTNDCFTGYNTDNSLIASNYCYELALSTMGQIIVSGDKGLSYFDTERNIFKVVELGTALPIAGINNGCGLLVCQNGEVFVGGIDGLTTYFEQQLFAPTKEYQLYFSDLYVNNEIVQPNDPANVLATAFPYTRKIDLKHNQNNLILNFATNNYINSLKKAVYEYSLEGLDEKWISTSNNSIVYTNLNPGKYTLVVREKQFDPNVLPQTIRMEIVVHSPFYATPLFYLIYVVIVLGILYSIFRFKRSQLLLQTSLQMERKEKETIEELNQAKLQFFSNISHEFRTPLTLIISQIEILLQSSSLSPSVYNKLLKVYKNTYHMRNLISELLDFRKLEQGHVKLKVFEQDIVPFLKEIYLSFYEYAASRSIIYKFTVPEDQLTCWFDPKQMQKVFFNLLSNAFKYTKPNATIELVVEDREDSIVIKVIDNGVGIKKEDFDKIFDRFYQADNGESNILRAPSTGIGLALTKNIILLHHGTIHVESTPGYGSIFVVRLFKGRSHFTDEECRQTEPEAQVVPSGISPSIDLPDQVEEMAGPIADEEGEDTNAGRTILLVEDNEEILQVLVSIFKPTYHILQARNGQEGLEKVREEMPDIIVSDIMMPEMSGTEMCMKIKNDFNMCHIPVILLTALTSPEQSIEGLQRGADDYIHKPFNAKVLLARCNNLVRNRIILQKKYNRQKDFDAQSLASNPVDQKFLDTVNAIIGKNLDNIEFDMNMLARELGLSRSTLYAKFKSLTGMTPNDFVLNSKLKHAAQMLLNNPELQIADISDRLGFGSPRYFTRCFKAQFDITPAEYRKKTEK